MTLAEIIAKQKRLEIEILEIEVEWRRMKLWKI